MKRNSDTINKIKTEKLKVLNKLDLKHNIDIKIEIRYLKIKNKYLKSDRNNLENIIL